MPALSAGLKRQCLRGGPARYRCSQGCPQGSHPIHALASAARAVATRVWKNAILQLRQSSCMRVAQQAILELRQPLLSRVARLSRSGRPATAAHVATNLHLLLKNTVDVDMERVVYVYRCLTVMTGPISFLNLRGVRNTIGGLTASRL